ncbi:MAG: epimerase, partial [Caldiserica bacterium]
LLKMLEELTGVRAPSFKVPYLLITAAAPLIPIYYSITRTKPLFTSYSIKVLGSNSLISSKKAKEELGYTARPVKESLKDAMQWFKKMEKINF